MAFLAQVFGVLLIGWGVFAIVRRRAKGSPEGENEREYRGASAVGLGVLWVVLGIAFVLFPSLMLR